MYLLARAGGIQAQRALWRLARTDRLVIADLSLSAVERSSRLTDQYADLPMDLADATLVALAEEGIGPYSLATPILVRIGSADGCHSDRFRSTERYRIRRSLELATVPGWGACGYPISGCDLTAPGRQRSVVGAGCTVERSME
jgi:hypothetical protein